MVDNEYIKNNYKTFKKISIGTILKNPEMINDKIRP